MSICTCSHFWLVPLSALNSFILHEDLCMHCDEQDLCSRWILPLAGSAPREKEVDFILFFPPCYFFQIHWVFLFFLCVCSYFVGFILCFVADPSFILLCFPLRSQVTPPSQFSLPFPTPKAVSPRGN